jgi:hypothetical protein
MTIFELELDRFADDGAPCLEHVRARWVPPVRRDPTAKPPGYLTHADIHADDERLIAEYLAKGGTVTVYPTANAGGLN